MVTNTLSRLPGWVPRVLSALVLVLSLWPTSLLSAQSIRGRLLDEETGDPIPGAGVTLLAGSKGGRIVRGVLTDSMGEFFIEAEEEGRFRLKSERIGYKSVTSPPFDLLTQDTLEVVKRNGFSRKVHAGGKKFNFF